jgi:hypothetical protein
MRSRVKKRPHPVRLEINKHASRPLWINIKVVDNPSPFAMLCAPASTPTHARSCELVTLINLKSRKRKKRRSQLWTAADAIIHLLIKRVIPPGRRGCGENVSAQRNMKREEEITLKEKREICRVLPRQIPASKEI